MSRVTIHNPIPCTCNPQGVQRPHDSLCAVQMVADLTEAIDRLETARKKDYV